MKLAFCLVFLVCLTHLGLSQHVVLEARGDAFGAQVATMLQNTNNPEAAAIGQDFQALWPASFSANQQQQVMDIAIELQDRKFAVSPFQRDFFGALTAGIQQANLSGTKLDHFLEMIAQSMNVSTSRNLSRELVNLRTFFERSALHFSRYNSLYAIEGKFDFKFGAPQVEQEYVPPVKEKKEKARQKEPEDDWGSDDGWGDDSGWGDEADDSWGDADEADEDEEVRSWAEIDEATDNAVLYSFQENALSTPMPQIEGATIIFDRVDLIIASNYDSVIIKNTSGTFLLDKYMFVGNGGTFDWSSAGFAPDQVYVTLEDYSFNTRNPYLEASNAKLNYKEKIDKEAEGFFEFKSVKHDSTDTSYPRFISYNNDIRLNFPTDENLEYIGGISLEGQRLVGASAYGRESKIELSDAEGKKFKVYSKLFQFQDTVITSFNSRATVYHGRDSITHPSVKTRYYTDSKRFVAIKDKNGYSLRPFNASYFNMTIEADIIDWDLKSDSLNISILNAKSMLPAYFKSGEYFDFDEIQELTGVYNFNPLLVVYNYGTKNKTREFYVTNLIEDLNLNEKAVRGAMEHLLYLDFIEYDNVGGRIYIKDKALHYVRSKNNRKDYDDLLIPSLATKQPNSTLHLDTDELTVRGIDKFFISEILDVYIYPKDNQVQLLKNRDFKFDGQLFAGNFEFVGRNFTFRYDSFLVDLQNIDSIKFYVDGEGQYEKRQVDNKLVSLEQYQDDMIEVSANNSSSGTLYINRPDNKSGRKIFPQYPTFDAERGAIVYFDGEETLNGAYDKSVYFLVPPFGIDSLSSSDPATIGFEGSFVTGGILPEFKERLKIMDDNSLGFEHTISQDGFALYDGPGKLYNKVKLDKSGLVGSGKIDYLSSSSYSDNYVFYLDSMVAEGTNFKLNEGDYNGVSYPDIYTNNFNMKWEPKQDHMYVHNLLDSFQLYDNTATLNGFIDLNTKGVNGGGTMSTRGFESRSDEFSFSQYDLTAKHSFFKLASDNPEKPLLKGDDIRLEFDFTRDVADISPEIEGMAALDFPYAQIKTSISKAQWNLQEQKVYMTKPPDVDIENSYFYATRKELDSLAFNAEAAVYDIPSSQLKVSGIPYIVVGDAMITPENNEVLILENALIGELYNTTIVIDTLNEYHRLIDGTIQIHSRTSFSGDATYQFVNALKDTFNIKFGKFELWKDPLVKNAKLQTVSSGVIAETNKMKISEGTFYKGDVTMYAQNKALKLDGYIQFDLPSRTDYSTWVQYSSMDEEAQEVMFDFNQAVTESGQKLNAGIHYGSLNNELYATFAQEKKLDTDDDFFKPDGILHYDPEKDMFMIEDTAKTNGHQFSGKVFGYNDHSGEIEFEGPVKFVESNENAALTASGFGSGNVNSGQYQINTLLKFDYKLPEQALMVMAADLFEVIENFGAPEAENDPDAFLYKVAEIIGERATVEYDRRNKEAYVPIGAFTPKMAGSMVFSKVDMKWSPTSNAWYSVGKVGLSNILKADINAQIDGFIEIKRSTERGNVMNVFIQVSSDCWYFLGYEDNKLMIYSSNSNFVDIIASKSNISKAGFGEYVFVDADLPDVLKFVDRFRLEYLGIREPYEIHVPVSPVSETLDILQIPVDNTEEELMPGEVEDNTETVKKKKRGKPIEAQTEEDLLNPVQEPAKDTEKPADDDEGF